MKKETNKSVTVSNERIRKHLQSKITRDLIDANNVWASAHNFYSTMAKLCSLFKKNGLVEKDEKSEVINLDNGKDDDFAIYPYYFSCKNQEHHIEAVVASMIASLESRLNKRLDEINNKLDQIIFNTNN